MRRNLYLLLVVLALGTIAYLPSLNNGFVYDDEYTVVRNSLIKSWHRLPHLVRNDYFTLSAEQSYRPVVTLSYFLDYALWGLKPFGYHLTNLLLHLAVVSILFLFFTELVSRAESEMRYRYVPFVAAALFAVHPINSEAVNCISYREDLLCAFFFLLALILYVKIRGAPLTQPSTRGGEGKGEGVCYVISLLCFFLALLSKEMAVTLPAIVIIYDLIVGSSWRKGRSGLGKRLSRYAGFFIVIIAYVGVAFFVMRGEALDVEGLSISGLYSAGLTKSWVVACDLGAFFRPVLLSAEYVVTVPTRALAVWLPIGFVLLFASLAWLLRFRDGKLIVFGCAWFFVTLLPVSGVYPIFNIRADRYLYLPSMGLCLAIALILNLAVIAGVKRRVFRIGVAPVLFIILITALCIITMKRSTVWRDNFTLWTDALAKAPGSARAHTILGNAYMDRKDYSRARREYETAIALDPRFVDAHNDLGALLCEIEAYTDAIEAFRKATELYPRHPESYYNLGYTYKKMGHWREAVRGFEKALELKAGLAEAHLQLALIYKDRGEEDPSLREFERALDLNPDLVSDVVNEGSRMAEEGKYEEAYDMFTLALKFGRETPDLCFNLGVAAERIGRGDEAARNYRRAIELDAGHAHAYDNLGRLYYRQGMWDKAVDYHRHALAVDTRSARSRMFLGEALLERGEHEEAVREFKEAIRLQPGLLDARNNLGVALGRSGDYRGARREWERILKIDPRNEPARRNLEQLREMGH